MSDRPEAAPPAVPGKEPAVAALPTQTERLDRDVPFRGHRRATRDGFAGFVMERSAEARDDRPENLSQPLGNVDSAPGIATTPEAWNFASLWKQASRRHALHRPSERGRIDSVCRFGGRRLPKESRSGRNLLKMLKRAMRGPC